MVTARDWIIKLMRTPWNRFVREVLPVLKDWIEEHAPEHERQMVTLQEYKMDYVGGDVFVTGETEWYLNGYLDSGTCSLGDRRDEDLPSHERRTIEMKIEELEQWVEDNCIEYRLCASWYRPFNRMLAILRRIDA